MARVAEVNKSMAVYSKRADVPLEQTWNRESVFQSWDEFQQELDNIVAGLPDLEKFSGRLGESSAVIAEWLEAYTQTGRRIGRLMTFVRMASAVDTNDAEAKAKLGQVMSLLGRFNAAGAFAEPELLTLDDKLRQWARQDPRLNIYMHYFDNLLRQRLHTQSPDVEKVLGMLQDPFGGPFQTYSELTNTDMKFRDALDSSGQTRSVTQGIMPPSNIQSHDRVLRRNAWESFYDQHLAMQNTLASNLITNIKQHVFLARVRGYGSVLEARLAPANLPVEVFHNLIDTFKANLPVWHRYWEARRKALGVDQLHPYDIWAPLAEDAPQLSYAQAVQWICAGLGPLGSDYVNVLRRGALEERWVDYAQNEGRRQGAFASAAYATHPFVFNTFDGSLGAMSVLAHELGHAMHSYLMNANQPEIYNGYSSGSSSSVAETASNFHQAMVRAYLREAKADDKSFQLTLISEAMGNFHRYFFIMPILARFELEVYSRAERDQPLNAAIFNDIMRRLFTEGYGDTMTDDADRTAITWGQFLHLYMPYYSFQYSVGISAAHALAGGILAGNEGAVADYLGMLKAGWSLYAPDLFKLAGVDMTHPEPVIKTFGVLERLVEQLESLVET
jgi:oligoendopeptidase F